MTKYAKHLDSNTPSLSSYSKNKSSSLATYKGCQQSINQSINQQSAINQHFISIKNNTSKQLLKDTHTPGCIWPTHGTRPKGRPPKRWTDSIKSYCRARNLGTLAETGSMAQDRKL